MSSLADLPEVIGFFSYSREDDDDSEGTLSALRVRIQRELSAQLGRSRTNFRLWQDQEAIAPGKLWESAIKEAVQQAVFFIPIVTPRAVHSHHCKFEFAAFLARESALGRTDLVFPLLYMRVPALENEALWRQDPVLSIIGKRQYVDWRPLRHLDVRTPAVREQIERFCDKIVEALREPWVSPEERRVEAARQAKEEKRRAEAARLAEEEKRRAEAARLAEEEKRRAEAARLAEEERQRAEGARLAEEERQRAEAARLAEEERLRAEAARLAEEERQRAEAAQQAEEEKRRADAAREAEKEERQRVDVAPLAEEEAARLAGDEKRRAESTCQEEDERQGRSARRAAARRQWAEVARQAAQKKQRAEAERQEEEKRRAEVERRAEGKKQLAEAARLVEEKNERAEAARQAKRASADLGAADWRVRLSAVITLTHQTREMDRTIADAARLALQSHLQHEDDDFIRASIIDALPKDERVLVPKRRGGQGESGRD